MRWEEARDGGGGGMGIAIRKIAVDTRKQGKVTLILEKVFLQPVLL